MLFRAAVFVAAAAFHAYYALHTFSIMPLPMRHFSLSPRYADATLSRLLIRHAVSFFVSLFLAISCYADADTMFSAMPDAVTLLLIFR